MNPIQTKPLCASLSNLADMLTMVNPIDFGGHSSKVKLMMGIIDKCGVHGDTTLCIVIFFHATVNSYFLLVLFNCMKTIRLDLKVRNFTHDLTLSAIITNPCNKFDIFVCDIHLEYLHFQCLHFSAEELLLYPWRPYAKC